MAGPDLVTGDRPTSTTLIDWPAPGKGHPSPADWRDEVIYFLLPDRFSDGRRRPRLDRSHPETARPAGWSWQDWATSGYRRFQGGTLAGVATRLDYLADLGATALWLGPCFKQRAESDDYHGYAIQDFLDVDPRFGTRADLRDLVREAHARDIRVILDAVVNHTGKNWVYASQLTPAGLVDPPDFHQGCPEPLPFGAWLDGDGRPMRTGTGLTNPDDGVWPRELQDPHAYHRAGKGSYGRPGAESDSAFAEFRRSDYENRDLALSDGPNGETVLQTLIACWRYWLTLTDCDGFRLDTFKHFRVQEGRRFCGAIQEYATLLGKDNFLLAAEIGGGDEMAERYLNRIGHNLSAVLGVDARRGQLRRAAAGREPARVFLSSAQAAMRDSVEDCPPSDASEKIEPRPGGHRALGTAFLTSLDDHDNLAMAPRTRFAADNAPQLVIGVALLLYSIGVPVLYYGTEQALAGPVGAPPDLRWCDENADGADRYLREAMFGPEHPRASGRAGHPGTPGDPGRRDTALPGFGVGGSVGHEVFDQTHPAFVRVRHLIAVRQRQIALRRGRQYARPIRVAGGGFADPPAGAPFAWSRILGDVEDVVVANPHPEEPADLDVLVDAGLHPDGAMFTVVGDTASEGPQCSDNARPVGTVLPVRRTGGDADAAFLDIRGLAPGQVRVLTNRPAPADG